jgi:hypothetical protein
MLDFLKKSWGWIVLLVTVIVGTVLVITYLEPIRAFIQENWYGFALMTVPAYSAGVFTNSFIIRKIIATARKTGKDSLGVNFGELAAIDITDKTRDNLWFNGILFILSAAATVLIFVL